MFSKNRPYKFIYLVLILLTVFTRFYGLNWGSGYHFHPDENNMATSLSQLTLQDLNPRFFAYGQFTLYLGYFSLKLFSITNSFINSVSILRLWSAVFSSISVFVFFLISRKLFEQRLAILASLLYIFYPGLIQLSHFGTTESLLILIFLTNIYLTFNLIEKPKNWSTYFYISLSTGIGLAAKISSLVFLFPIVLGILISLFITKNRAHFIPKLFLISILIPVIFIIFSPYSVIKISDFLSTQIYEAGVATGKNQIFYTHQFIDTPPYLFQLTKVFPYTSGLFMYTLGLAGLVFLIFNYKKTNKINKIYWLIILSSSLIYFSYFGQLFVKWTRFVSPLFFLTPLMSVYLLSKINNSLVYYLIVLICCLPGTYFMKLYFSPDIRVTASDWIVKNIPSNSNILSEGGNVVNIPLLPNNLNVINYDFYNYQPVMLVNYLISSDYIIVPSRRVFKNYDYKYYQALFNGQLGFIEIKRFQPDTDILLNPENAEETWSVFDRPTIRIYKKIRILKKYEYESLLKT